MHAPRNKNPRLVKFARQMRSAQTDAEIRMWSLLRSRQLSGYKFRRQHPVEDYILDFYCVQHRVAIELDGGQHDDPKALKYDQERTNRLNDLGITVLRFWDNDVLKSLDSVADEILRCVESRPSPQPSPGLPGEGVRGI
jgi:very-short-patch-repair endonuclease